MPTSIDFSFLLLSSAVQWVLAMCIDLSAVLVSANGIGCAAFHVDFITVLDKSRARQQSVIQSLIFLMGVLVLQRNGKPVLLCYLCRCITRRGFVSVNIVPCWLREFSSRLEEEVEGRRRRRKPRPCAAKHIDLQFNCGLLLMIARV